jgi:hypothetical protein
MSKAKPQTTDREDAEGLRILGNFAKEAGLDLNASSEQMFRCSPESLTRAQGLELLKMFLRATPPKPTHNHFCVECGEAKSCEKTDCEHNETICYRCNDGDASMVRPDYWLHNKAAVMQ